MNLEEWKRLEAAAINGTNLDNMELAAFLLKNSLELLAVVEAAKGYVNTNQQRDLDALEKAIAALEGK